MRQHAPFKSIYLDKFEIVEQVQRNRRLFPHTEQLPAISRAINLEFYGGLPDKIAHVDARADDYHKGLLNLGAVWYCRFLNDARGDALRLFPVLTPDRVTHIGIVQHITELQPRGAVHRYRFYTGRDFAPDVYLSGRTLVFTDHAQQRFTERVSTTVATHPAELLTIFYWDCIVAMTIGKRDAFVFDYNGSPLAFPFEETDDELIVTTCLTTPEISELQLEIPPRVFNAHYGKAFSKPVIRNWIPEGVAKHIFEKWRDNVTAPVGVPPRWGKLKWSDTAHTLKTESHRMGRVDGIRMRFTDNLHGPAVRYFAPGKGEFAYDIREEYSKTHRSHYLAYDRSPRGPQDPANRPYATLEELNAAIAAKPGDYGNYLMRAQLHRDAGDYTSALADINKAIEFQPQWAHPYNERAWVLYKLGALDDAFRDATESLRLDGRSSCAYDTRAWIQVMRGKLKAARSDCEYSLRYAHDRRNPEYTRGLLHYIDRQYTEAIAEWTQAIARNPISAADLSPWLAKAEALGKCRADVASSQRPQGEASGHERNQPD